MEIITWNTINEKISSFFPMQLDALGMKLNFKSCEVINNSYNDIDIKIVSNIKLFTFEKSVNFRMTANFAIQNGKLVITGLRNFGYIGEDKYFENYPNLLSIVSNFLFLQMGSKFSIDIPIPISDPTIKIIKEGILIASNVTQVAQVSQPSKKFNSLRIFIFSIVVLIFFTLSIPIFKQVEMTNEAVNKVINHVKDNETDNQNNSDSKVKNILKEAALNVTKKDNEKVAAQSLKLETEASKAIVAGNVEKVVVQATERQSIGFGKMIGKVLLEEIF